LFDARIRHVRYFLRDCEDVLGDLVMKKSLDAAGIFATFGHWYAKVPT
jgi:hypothetical protein